MEIKHASNTGVPMEGETRALADGSNYLAPISQMNLMFHVTRQRFCYKNQYLEALTERLAWHTRWVIQNGMISGSVLTVA
jgi:hypothetical protein